MIKLVYIELHEIIGKLILSSFKRWNQSDVLENKLAEKVCKHLNLTERVLEKINTVETKKGLFEHGNNVESKTQSSLSLTASKNDSRARREHMRL